MSHPDPEHDFGPVPTVAPAHGIGFHSTTGHVEPAPEALLETVAAPDQAPDAPAPRHAAAVDPVDVPPDDPAIEVHPDSSAPVVSRPGRHRRERSAISGTVRSTRGRGLRDMQVVVLDEQWQVVATAVTGVGGAFLLEDLAPGAYRVMATDELDGDFGAAWHESPSYPRAGILQVKEGRTRRNIDITLASAPAIDLSVDVRRKKAVVGIRVAERATGVRAGGSVRISTKLFAAELMLAKGRTTVTLLGSADGTPRLGKKLRVDYLGTTHVQPGSASIRLR